ncbi:hypothetical protein [Variovorax sp. WS11]|uniref:hypothetical protein n=2 Tax=Variovorax sp. WS11 TaxID=1105204 RepID=UPI0013DA280D|nr:hypothetical protein [Variovorax sp. WS11]NDZ15672.1 hypothetical protein [Variovorax sp. WS11]
MTHMHLRAGISDTEWFRRSLFEARTDQVGMWQMVKAGREGFGLSGTVLAAFVRRFIEEMVAGGAEPIVGDMSAPFGWSRTTKYGIRPLDIAISLVDEWTRSGVDPDVDGVWFAFPSAF